MKQYTLKPFATDPSKLGIDYRMELNDEQYRAVVESNGPCLVLAGAGSGKTRTLVYKVAYLLEQGVKADRILLMTFTNKASREMLNRVEVLLKVAPKGLWGGTFHHIGNRVLRLYGKHIGIAPDFTILDQEDATDLVRTCVAELDFTKDKYFPKAEAIEKIISLSVNVARPIAEIVADYYSYLDENVVPMLERIAKLYQEKKQRANSVDYDDLLVKWNDLLVKVPEVRERLSKQFQHILVDEYQDTNAIQGELIKNLAGSDASVLAVGDDAQSIYSFRGATIANILNFPKIFPGAKVFKLESNYRSTPEILGLANESIKHNTNQFEKTLQTNKPSGDKPALVGLADADEQADFICQRILELQTEAGLSLNEVAILFRAHYQSLELEMALSKRSIPYEMRGGVRFFEQAHIKDVVAHLKALHNIGDELSWTRMLRLQSGIGATIAQKIWQQVSDASSAAEAAGRTLENLLSSKSLASWQGTARLMTELSTIGPANVAALIQAVIRSGYDRYVAATFENAQDRLEDLLQLVEFAGHYDSIEKFLADVALSEGFKGQSIIGYDDAPEEALTLSTVHQAKGLEWKLVFVVGLSEGQFPYAKSYERPEQLEEERRLFYVAVTRAKDALYLTYPLMTRRGDVFARPSQFIGELPEKTYERWEIGGPSRHDDLSDGDVRYIDEERGSILDVYLNQARQNKRRPPR